MRDEKRGFILRHFVILGINFALGNRIERRCRLVKDEHGSIFVQRAGEHQLLRLAAG